jgi:citrate lyase subunit beta/citryl-CoA lyase
MPGDLRPRRSALYVPGANERALEKARSIAADVLILDLEDSVAPDRKDKARDAVAAAVAALTTGRREIVVRVNGLDTPWIARDIAAMAAAKPDAILVPKLSRSDDIRRTRAAMAAAHAPRTMNLWAMIETPAAVLNASAMGAIAAMPAPAITCYVVGTNDLAAELGAAIRPGRAAMLPHLAQVVVAARAHGLAVLDGTFNDLDDAKALDEECRQGRDLGMDGKTLIHPAQVAVANAAFGPSRQDIAGARKVIEAFAAPENTGKDVIKVDGRMVERLHERMARRTLELAETIRTMGEASADA